MQPRLSRPALAGLLCGLVGCQAISSRLGLGDEEGTSTSAEVQVDVGSETAEAEPKKKRKRRKRKPKPPPPPEAEFDTALARSIIAVPGESGLYRIDPFVLTLVADTLGREGDIPFTRTTKKQRRDGVPAAFRVGELPKPSLWRRLGLRPGDLVLEVQGAKPPGPKRLLELRKRIPREGTLTVSVQRNGVAKTLRYRIEPGLAWTRYLEVEGERTFDPPPSKRPSSGGSSTSGTRAPSKASGGSKPAAVPVTCKGSTCRVPKWYVDSLVGSSSKARQQMRGKSIGSGYKITFVGPASRKAGFAVGEVITKINGSRTNNQLAMLGLYGRLKSTKKFRVESTRGGHNRVTTIIVE